MPTIKPARGAGDPLFGEEESEGQKQEFVPQLASVAVAQDREA